MPSSSSKPCADAESVATTATFGSTWEDSPGRIERRAQREERYKQGRCMQYGVKRVDSTTPSVSGDESSDESTSSEHGECEVRSDIHVNGINPKSESMPTVAVAQPC